MSEVSSTSAPPGARGGDPGFFAHGSRLLGGIAGYAKARLALVGIESKEAAVHYAIILALVLAAAVLSIFGYLFVVITIVFAIAAAAGGGNAWLWVVGAAALLHLLVAAGILFLAWRRLKAPMLEYTLEELRKDKEWLNHLAKKP